MAAGTDDGERIEAAPLGLDAHVVRGNADTRHANAATHVGSSGGCPLEQEVVELAPDDAVARRLSPSRLMTEPFESERTCFERLDGQRVLRGIELEVVESGGRHPPGADLDAGKDGRVQDQRMQALPRKLPRCGAAAGSSTDHDDVDRRHAHPFHKNSISRSLRSGERWIPSTALATSIAE